MKLRIKEHESGEFTVDHSIGQKKWMPLSNTFHNTIETAQEEMVLFAMRGEFAVISEEEVGDILKAVRGLRKEREDADRT